MSDSSSPASAAPFALYRPAGPAGAFVFSSPHSGRYYPDSFKQASRLDEITLRRSEDSYVDELFLGAPETGAPLLAATYARAYVDLNREPHELDPLLFAEPLPNYANSESERVGAGLGTIARVVATGIPIYSRPLSLEEAHRRIAAIYTPYHDALGELLDAARRRHGWCALIDCHSMPSPEASMHRPASPQAETDIVLGDRYGQSCDSRLTDCTEAVLTGLGYTVARNLPYAGGYCTSSYGRPEAGMHALQIEINRGLYMDEMRIEKAPGFAAVARDMTRLAAALAELDLSAEPPLAAE